jgi:hypothetical protein
MSDEGDFSPGRKLLKNAVLTEEEKKVSQTVSFNATELANLRHTTLRPSRKED